MVIQVYCTKVLYHIFGIADDGTTFSMTPTGQWVESSNPITPDELVDMVHINETTLRV